MLMMALSNDDKHFASCCIGIKDFLIAYARHIGNIDMKVFEILVNSNEMSTEELVKYINDNSYSREDEITEIYEVGKKVY